MGGAWLCASPVGSISGSVKDPTGAFVPGVKLTLTSTATNATVLVTSNANGEFQFLQLPPATYSLVAEVPGFKKETVPEVLDAMLGLERVVRR